MLLLINNHIFNLFMHRRYLNRYSSIAMLLCLTLLYNQQLILLHLHKWQLLDKVGHFIGFSILFFIIYKLVKLNLTVLLVTLIIYSGLTEVGQEFLGFRNGQLSDFIADSFGCLTCYLILMFYERKLKS